MNASTSKSNSLLEVFTVLHSYKAEDPTELSINAGDSVNIRLREGDWAFGECGSRRGWFPILYVAPKGADRDNILAVTIPQQGVRVYACIMMNSVYMSEDVNESDGMHSDASGDGIMTIPNFDQELKIDFCTCSIQDFYSAVRVYCTRV